MHSDLEFDALLAAAATIPQALLGRPAGRPAPALVLPPDPFDGVYGVIDVSEALIPAQWSHTSYDEPVR